MKVRLTTTAVALGILTSFTAYADELSDLKEQTKLLSERLDKMEKAKKETSPAATASKSTLITDGKGLNVLDKEDTQVKLYGLVDVSVGAKSNATASGRTKAGMFIGQMSASRWGIYASHLIDKASGTKAIARFEGEFETPSGKLDTANTVFNRMAWVGVESDTIGKLTIGRQNTVARDFTGVWNPYGSTRVTYAEGGYSNNANTKDLLAYNVSRSDGAIVWKKVIGPWAVGAMYGFGYVDNGSYMAASTTNSSSQFGEGSTAQIALAYNGDRFTVVGAGTHMLAKHLAKDTFSIGGNYKLIKDLLMVKAGYARGSAEQGARGTRIDNAYVLSLLLTPAPKWSFEGGASYIDAKNAAYTSSGTLGITADPTSAIGSASGKRFVTFGALFYKFTSQFDVYAALNHVQTTDRYVSSNTSGTRNMTEYFTGMRFKF